MLTYEAHFSSPFGTLAVTLTDNAVTSLRFCECEAPPTETDPNKQKVPELGRWLDRYFSGVAQNGATAFPMMLEPSGSEFSRSVWALMREIPPGRVTTYGILAKALESRTGRRVAAQAVGGACKRNPIPLIIPCHRVVASNGVGGFSLGLPLKQRLLAHEHADLYAPPFAFQ